MIMVVKVTMMRKIQAGVVATAMEVGPKVDMHMTMMTMTEHTEVVEHMAMVRLTLQITTSILK